MMSPVLQPYIPLTQFLGMVLGPDYEVALLDARDPENAIVAIANGHISGRTVGAPITGLAREYIDTHAYEDADSQVNCPGSAMENGRILRVSTHFIKDTSGELAGMLSITFDDRRYQDLSDKLLKLRHPDAFVETNFAYNKEKARPEADSGDTSSSFHASVVSVTEQTIAQFTRERGIPAERMNKDEKKQVIQLLEEKGVFLVKNAVKVVAEQMGCSQATIYRYLKK